MSSSSDERNRVKQPSTEDCDTRSDISSDSSNYHSIIKHMLNLYEHNLITPEDLSIILERLKDKTNEKYIVRNRWCGSLFVFVELGRLDGLARLGW